MEASDPTGNTQIIFKYQNLMLSYSDKPYSTIKPGQDKERDYFSKATHERPNG